MGSFNVACAISHLSISPGDPCVMIPLRKSKYFFKEFGPEFYQSFQVYPPLKGIYDDYGQMRDIQPSAYHDAWQVGPAFKDIAQGNDPDPALAEFTYAWVRGEVWDRMIQEMPRGGARGGALYQADISAEVLTMLGFVEYGIIEGEDRYNRRFVDHRVPGMYIGSDGTWIRVFKDGVVQRTFLYHPDHLVEFWPMPLATEALANLRHVDLIVADKFAKYAKELAYEMKTRAWVKEADPEFYETLLERVPGSWEIYQAESGLRLEGVLTPVCDHLAAIQPEICDLVQFLMNCSTCNILITPSIHGPQCGEQHASYILATLIQQIAQADYDDRRAQEEEEEEEEEEGDE